MFGMRSKKKPAYYNPWYDLSLNAVGSKIAHTVKDNKTYSNIPFGRSLLDIHSDSEYVFVTIKTPFNGEMVLEEFREVRANLDFLLQPYKFEKRWEKADKKIVFTPETLKQICHGIAQLVNDSDAKQDTWIFPYFNFFVQVKIDEVKRPNGRKWISGNAYLQDFTDEYGCGGGISGTFLEDGEPLKVDRYGREEYVFRLDHSIYTALSISFKWPGTFDEKKYAAIGSPQVPVKVLERIS